MQLILENIHTHMYIYTHITVWFEILRGKNHE